MNKIDKRRKQVLIIECDSPTLEREYLAIGKDIQTELLKAFPENGIDLIKAIDKSNFDEDLSFVLNEYRNPCKAVVIVGHGNEFGIKLTSNVFVNWHELSLLLEPFGPDKLLFIACKAGDFKACEILFENIPSLKHIFASPVEITKNQQYFVTNRISYTLASSKKEKQWVEHLMQGINALATREWMFSRTRKEYENGELGLNKLFEKGLIILTDWLFKDKSNQNYPHFKNT